MAKVVIWTNKNKTFKLTKQHIQWLEEHNIAVPRACSEYDNFDACFIESVEKMQDMALENLSEEYKLYSYLQGVKVHFTQVFNGYEAYVAKFWSHFLALNKHIIGSPKIDGLFNSVMYLYSWDDFAAVCKELNANTNEEIEYMYSAIMNRRAAVEPLRTKMDNAHDDYIHFCSHVGMRAFSHIPAICNFEVVEFDDTKEIAHVTVHSDKNCYKWEEVSIKQI